MPIRLNDNEYKLVFLDTNAISEISKNIRGATKGFITIFPPTSYVPVMSMYNVFELQKTMLKDKGKTTYDSFLEFFRIYPFFLVWPYRLIVEYEATNKISEDISCIFLGAFTKQGNSLRKWSRSR